jgi:predicted molibdopterin-dependent oxidoreductase YjgC
LWGSNARETHPIFFHHLLKGIRRGARLISIDPRRTSSAQWADLWAGLDVGTDIALAHAVAREICEAGLWDREFVANATSGFEEYRASIEPWTLERGAAYTGVPAEVIREIAHTYATSKTAILCWTLGITEHHNAVDTVVALINLALLTGHVGRWACGINPLRGQNNVQGGGDMGALPDRLPGFQHLEQDEVRQRVEAIWGRKIPPKRGLHLSAMMDAMEHGQLKTVYAIGENPIDSEADRLRTQRIFKNLDFLVVQDIFMTGTARIADVVLPAAVAFCESEGTVTSSERRVQRVRRAMAPPGEAREDVDILCDLAKRLGHDWGEPDASRIWDELCLVSPLHGGMSYRRLEELGGLQWPCYDQDHPGELFLHQRLWEWPLRGPRAAFQIVQPALPVDQLSDDFPLRLTTGRRLAEYNTGVQTGGYVFPTRRGETLDLSPEDAASAGVAAGEVVRIRSRRGAVEAPVYIDRGLRPGLAFMTFHFPDQVATNVLTIEATDPRSGTAEFKASAIRIEKLGA